MNTRSFGLVAQTSLFTVAKPAPRGATRFARFSMRALAFLLVCFGALGAANLLAQGTLTSGEMAHGDISAANEIDTWTFTANAGDSLIVRMGEMIAGSSLSPWVRLMGPNGVLLSQATGAAAAEASFRATNSGTFTVLVGDGNSSHLGTGPYRLTLARSGVAGSVASGDEGGSLTNGLMQTGFIDVGDLDLWTFTANAGDNFAVRVAESVSGSSLGPWIRLYSPDGVLLDQDATAVGVEATFRATNGGTFLVVIGDGNIGLVGSGPYRITLAKTGSAVEVSPGDEGGPLTNGIMHTGVIEVGDLDVWTFTANAGDNFAVRIGETSSSSSLAPTLRLYGPTGLFLGVSVSAVGAEVAFRATNNGTFLVVVGDGNNGLVGSGPYRLTLAKTGSPVEVSAGDEGGPLTNGIMHTGFIDVGDLDVWTFTANAGENFAVRVGETVASSSLALWIRLYGPTGVLLREQATAVAAEASFRATNSGTFLVVVGDGNNGFVGSGPYRLTLAKTGSPVQVSDGDEGGPLTNGIMHMGFVDVGDLDLWTFTANAGESFVVRAGETNSGSSFAPALRLLSPDGVFLDVSATAIGAEVSFRATNSGTFLVVVGDGNTGFVGSGSYRLTLAKTGSPVEVSPDDQGGPLTNGIMHTGSIEVGDLDVYSFTACVGDPIAFTVTELEAGSSFVPWVRLYGRDGVLLNSVAQPATAQISRPAPATGTYTIVIGDGNIGLGGAGGYRLSTLELSAGLKLCRPTKLGGGNLLSGGVGGPPGATFVVITATNITTPFPLWVPILTNQFGAFGEFSFTNRITPGVPEQFFRLCIP